MTLLSAPGFTISGPSPVSLYADPDFLEVIAAVYHANHDCRVRDYAVGSDIFRLIEVVDRGPVVAQTFVDYHEPVGHLPIRGPKLLTLPRLPGVARGLQEFDEYRRQPDWEDGEGAPTVLWQQFPSWDDYLSLLQSRRALSEDRRRRRKLSNVAGELEFRPHDAAADVLPTCFHWKSQRDRSLGRTDLFADPRNRRFFHELSARGMLRASTLRGDGLLLAIWLGALHGLRWSGWVFTFNPAPELARCSPGRQLLYSMLEESFRSGHDEFDFSIGMEPYKLSFATHVRPIGLLGTAAPLDRAAQAARSMLGRYPRLYDTARALRRRLASGGRSPSPVSADQG